MLRRILKLGIAGLVASALVGTAAAQSADEKWRFVLTPYLWFPNINGTLNYNVGGLPATPGVKVEPSSYLANLDLALMVTGNARKGRWGVLTDLIYLDFSSQDSSVREINFNPGLPPNPISTTLNAGTQSTIKGMVWTLAGTYAAVEKPEGSLEVLGGFRYFGLKSTTNWQLTANVTDPSGSGRVFGRTGSISESEDLWDVVVGAQGRVALGGRWSLPYYVDVGTGSSSFTWQGLIAVTYSFDWGDLGLGYRYLFYNQSGNKLLQDVGMGGPMFGATFRF